MTLIITICICSLKDYDKETTNSPGSTRLFLGVFDSINYNSDNDELSQLLVLESDVCKIF